jgi:hypothetical protein
MTILDGPAVEGVTASKYTVSGTGSSFAAS